MPVLVSSGRTDGGLDELRMLGAGRTVALLGPAASASRRSSTPLFGEQRQATTEVRSDHRGRHTVAAELLAVPDDGGWLIDTPGVRAMSLWLSGRGIEGHSATSSS